MHLCMDEVYAFLLVVQNAIPMSHYLWAWAFKGRAAKHECKNHEH